MPPTPVILVVGDLVTDIVAVHSGPIAPGSDTEAGIRIGGGGSAANTAAWLASVDGAGPDGIAVNGDVRMVGVVGNDSAGEQLIAQLTESLVDCRGVRRTRTAPTGSVIVLSDGRERSMLSDRGANLELAPADVDDAVADLVSEGGRWHLHLSGYPLLHAPSRPAGMRALNAAREAGATISVDAASAAPLRQVGGAAFRDWIGGADLLLANLDEAGVVCGDRAAATRETAGRETVARETVVAGALDLARQLVKVVGCAVVKCGPFGAVYACADGTQGDTDAVPVNPVDPTGAGDAFAAGFLSTWLGGAAGEDCLKAGVRLGARAVGCVGGRPTARR